MGAGGSRALGRGVGTKMAASWAVSGIGKDTQILLSEFPASGTGAHCVSAALDPCDIDGAFGGHHDPTVPLT